jgi:lipoprotein-anchoring transpeptidase ErfK/SrfK
LTRWLRDTSRSRASDILRNTRTMRRNAYGYRGYLGGTVYRIHGTNDPSTIGGHVSSGCIRLTNDDVIDLYSRVNIGTKVIVLPAEQRAAGLGGNG